MSILSSGPPDPSHLHAVVDMGSNGVRFSITTLQPPTTRIMPTLYQNRVAISLYDAQFNAENLRVPIPEATITDIISNLKAFKRTCSDFQVPEDNIAVLATEATRAAVNSENFIRRIKTETGWTVNLLPKEEEGRVGAMGVASSLPEISGLVMDLGGGSTQLSWIIKESTDGRKGGAITMSKAGAVSLPYGAAALLRRIHEAETAGPTKLAEFESDLKTQIRDAYTHLGVPSELETAAKENGGFTLFLSGGGFRGWGYILMSKHRVKPYPIPVINGFSVKRQEFLHTQVIKEAAVAALERNTDEDDLFRVSDRRASQVPAVAFLVSAIAEALPQLKEVRFCQGGVREGYLFSSMDATVRAQHPLVVATQQFAISDRAEVLVELLRSALPSETNGHIEAEYTKVFTSDLLTAFANMMYLHTSWPKDLQASAGLRSTTSGALGNVHGLLHESRVILALLLCARWGSTIPPSDVQFKRSLAELVESEWILWWVQYLGAVSSLLASVYPVGVPRNDPERIKLRATLDGSAVKHGRSSVALEISLRPDIGADAFEKDLNGIEKVGKRKRWIGGKDGAGHNVKILQR